MRDSSVRSRFRPSRHAEAVLASVLRLSPRTLPGRAALKAAIAARTGLIRLGDPLVRHRIGDVDLLLPLSHELPLYRHDHPQYDAPLGRLAALAVEKYPDLAAVDVGANVGDTAAVMRGGAPSMPILCIEGVPRFFELLEWNARRFHPPLDLEQAFVWPRPGRIRAVVEASAGTAHVRAGVGDEIVVQTLSGVLERHPRYAAAKLLKLDTDGHDAAILRAECDLLDGTQPVVFFEYDPHVMAEDDHDVLAVLRDVGYTRALVYENTGVYAGALSLADATALADLRRRYTGFAGARYADLAVFHDADTDLAERAERAEPRA
jgi:FkbM family methyltransferase